MTPDKDPIGQDPEYTSADEVNAEQDATDVTWDYYRSGPNVNAFCAPNYGFRIGSGENEYFNRHEARWLHSGAWCSHIKTDCRKVDTAYEAIHGVPDTSCDEANAEEVLQGAEKLLKDFMDKPDLTPQAHTLDDACAAMPDDMKASLTHVWLKGLCDKHKEREYSSTLCVPCLQDQHDKHLRAVQANVEPDLNGRRYRCDAHWDTPSTDEACVVCLLESVDTLTKEVAQLERWRTCGIEALERANKKIKSLEGFKQESGELLAQAAEAIRERDRAMGVAKAYGCHTFTAAGQERPVSQRGETDTTEPDLGAQLQYLFDRVRGVERVLKDVTQTVIPAGEKKLDEVERTQERVTSLRVRMDRQWERMNRLRQSIEVLERDRSDA